MTSRELREVGDGDIGGRSRAGSRRRGNHVGSVRRFRMPVHATVTPPRPPAPARVREPRGETPLGYSPCLSSAVGRSPVGGWAFRDYASWVQLGVGHVVVALDVVE